jgi:hypothetical protein
MKFTAKGREYEIDNLGVITQTDHRPFKYDPQYSAIYDKPEYVRGSEILQAMRLGFVQGAHGKVVNSLLDVGYGNGAFINFIKGTIPNIYGYDVTGVHLEGAYRMPELVKADAYTFWDCLEHIPDCSFLRHVNCETICISLPYCHYHELGQEWFTHAYHHLKPDEHIRHFTPWSLTAFMNQYGWTAVSESRHEDKIRIGRAALQNIIAMAFKRK